MAIWLTFLWVSATARAEWGNALVPFVLAAVITVVVVSSPKQDPTGPPSRENRPPLWPAVFLIVLAWLGAIGAGVYNALATFSFESTDRARFNDWVFAEFGRAAGVGCLVAAVATVIFALLQRRNSRFAIGVPIAAVLLVAALVGAAALSRAHRSHPIPQERAIARSVPLPARWGPGTLYVLPRPADPFGGTPPRVERVIDVPLAYPPVCRQLLASLTGWRGARLYPWGGGSTLGPLTPNLSSGLGCTMLGATPQGWVVTMSALVQSTDKTLKPLPAGMTRVIITVGTPDG
jgi:hypothetical protein